MYRLLEDGEVFDIDPSTGFLSLTSTLDTEAIPRYIPAATIRQKTGCVAGMSLWWSPATEERNLAALILP